LQALNDNFVLLWKYGAKVEQYTAILNASNDRKWTSPQAGG
jgi:hypothetical protein